MSDERRDANGAALFSVGLRAAGLLLFLAATTWAIVRYQANAWRVVTDPGELQAWVVSYGAWGPVVFLGMQIVQVVVFVIPGEVVQVAGGYLFGAWLGVGYCVVGAVVGSLLGFLIAKWLGRPFVRYLVTADQFTRMEDVLNRRQALVTLFVLYLIPGIPKDVLCYVAGVTPMHVGLFLAVSVLARLPGMVLSAYFGRAMAEKSYILLAILAALAFLALVFGLIFHRQIEAWISRRKAGGT